MAENSNPGPGPVVKGPTDKSFEVDELDDKNLEGAAGGVIEAEFADTNDHCTVNNAANC